MSRTDQRKPTYPGPNDAPQIFTVTVSMEMPVWALSAKDARTIYQDDIDAWLDFRSRTDSRWKITRVAAPPVDAYKRSVRAAGREWVVSTDVVRRWIVHRMLLHFDFPPRLLDLLLWVASNNCTERAADLRECYLRAQKSRKRLAAKRRTA